MLLTLGWATICRPWQEARMLSAIMHRSIFVILKRFVKQSDKWMAMETPGFSILAKWNVCPQVSECCSNPGKAAAPLSQAIADPASFADPVQVRPLVWGICEETVDSCGSSSLWNTLSTEVNFRGVCCSGSSSTLHGYANPGVKHSL